MRFSATICALALRMCTSVAALVMLGCVPPSAEPIPDLDTMDGSARVIDDRTPPAMDRYQTLLETLAPADARAALVQELTATPGVDSATLSSDGYTLRILYADGATAAINTNELDLEPIDTQQLSTLLAPIAKTGNSWRALPPSTPTQARALTGGWCLGNTWHEARKVKIVVAASVTNPSLISVGQRLHDGFIDRGWAEAEVSLVSRDGQLDASVLPDAMLDNADYGVVIIIAHSGVWQAKDGQDHFFVQCSSRDASYAFLDEFDPELRPKYGRWVADGRIETTWVWSESGEKIAEYWLRDDLFAAELNIDPNAIVHILSPNGCALRDEFVDAHGVGSFMCWDGAVRPNPGAATLLAMFGAMAGETPQTDVQAYDALRANGLAVSTDRSGRPIDARIADIPLDAYLPTWGEVWVDAGGIPDGTAQVNVRMTFPDACTDAAIEFTMDPAQNIEFDHLTPGRAVIALQALDSSGKVLGVGETELTISAGTNGIRLETCTAAVVLSVDVDTYLEFTNHGGDSIAVIHAELTPADLDAPHPAAIDVDAPAFLGNWGYSYNSAHPYTLWPGSATLTTTAKSATGVVLGTSTQTLNMLCGENTAPVCYGWPKLISRKYPFNAAKIRVTSSTGGNAAWPLTLAPGGAQKVYGYALNQVAGFTAEALDSFDQVLGSATVSRTLACGENEIAFDIISYGIILTVSSDQLAADGHDTATVTATLREWKTGDITEPTGDPVPGKSVKFSSDIGTLTGLNPVVTDANGQATIQLSSTQAGVTRLHAHVEADVVENKRIVQVVFGSPYGIVLSASPSNVAANGSASATITATLRRWTANDVTLPSGNPVAGKAVTFGTTLGTLLGANPATTDASGKATIRLSSTQTGTATLAASVLADGVDSGQIVQVNFNPPDALYVSGSASPDESLSYIYATSNSRICTSVNGVDTATYDAYNVWSSDQYNPATATYQGVLGYAAMCNVGDHVGVRLICFLDMEAEVGPLYVHLRKNGVYYSKQLCDRVKISQMLSRVYDVIIE